MDANDARRRLLWHGILIVFLALLEGGAIPVFLNPRMALSAHVGGLMTGMLVAIVGLAWPELRLDARTATLGFQTTVVAGYTNFLALVLAAIFGTSSMTPFAGGEGGTPWQEALVSGTLIVGAVTILVMCVIVLLGLRRRG